jgi:hypothetical protein
MAIDIRATVTCSLGTLISGSISDDYLQGSGLIKTRGSVEISALITPAVGTAVTFTYTKDGVTRSIPRKLRVLSSFADPFRRATKVELGCKLTYLSDLQEPLKWDAFDDPENASYTAEDDKIITIPIAASSVMSECLSKLGITASSSPLTNRFSVAEFDFGPGYVQVLGDLLVSECYFGYLDTSEVLQVRTLNVEGGTGPVFTSADIIDLGPIGVGQLPGEAVTVSYSTLKLKEPPAVEDEENTRRLNWEEDETISAPSTVRVENPFFNNNPFSFAIPQYFEYNHTPRSKTVTEYDALDRVTTRTTTDYTILAAIAPSYIQHVAGTNPQSGPGIGSIEYTTITTERITYAVSAQGADPKNPPEKYEEVTQQTVTVQEPIVKLNASTTVYDVAGDLNAYMGYGFENVNKFIAETTTTTYEYGTAVSGAQAAKTLTTTALCRGYTQEGQQELATFIQSLNSTAAEFQADVTPALEQAQILKDQGTQIQISTGREVGLQQRPSTADRTNAKYAKDGDPNNGWRVESSSELELAVGSATAQRRIEFSMPYAPDDRFAGPTGGPFFSIRSDAPQKAQNYGRAQNRLLLGNRTGINIQVAPERMPTAPFDPIYVQASGLTALYRANGNQWAFDSNGIVCSTDALFWGAVGGTGTFWFPVAPGITTLPAEPAIVDGAMNASNVVLPYNETAIYEGRVRLGSVASKFEYALTLLTTVPALNLKVPVQVRSIIKINVPAAPITLSGTAPQISIGTAIQAPASSVSVASAVPAVSTGAFVSIPATNTSITAEVPEVLGTASTDVLIPSIDTTVAGNVPEVITGASVSVPVTNTTFAAATPSVSVPATDPNFSSVSLLLHLDGSNGSTTFTDSSTNAFTVTAIGDAQISTAQSKFGGSSASFDGTGDMLSVADNAAWAFGSGDFTIEFWVRFNAVNVTQVLVSQATSLTSALSFDLVYASTGSFTFRYSLFGSSTSGTLTATFTASTNTWYHVAVTRSGADIKGFVDGTQMGSTLNASTNSLFDSGQPLRIGGRGSTAASPLNAFIDDLRITKGVARYTANFTPPTAAFPNS